MTTASAKWFSLALVVALAGCAQQSTRPVANAGSTGTIDYAKYVQGTVPWFHFSSLYSWDSHSDGHVVVWTGPLDAYRLTLAGPCIGLLGAPSIGLTSQNRMVSSNRDSVLAGRDRCRIMRIDKLDARAIRGVQDKSKARATNGG